MATVGGKSSAACIGITVALCISIPARAGDPPETKSFAAEIAVVSDYIFRGVSYTDGHPAFQASGSWTNGRAATLPGLHADAWVSMIDFGPGDPAKAEMSATLGYSGGEAVTYDIGATYIAYPGAPAALRYNYVDLYGSLGGAVGRMSATATVHVAPSYSGNTGLATFADLESAYALTELITVEGGVGHARLPEAAGTHYTYWNFGVRVAVKGFSASLRYHGNDLAACTSPCRDGVVFGLSRAF